jgi:TPR repeat protein
MTVLVAVLAAFPAVADAVLPAAIAGDPWLKDLRKSMLRGRDLSDRLLQSLADAGEGLAAARYARRLEAREGTDYLDDAAHYYSIAVYMGRDFAVPRLIAILKRPEADFSPARLRNLRAVLERAARKGDPGAAAGLADLLMRGKPFGTDIPEARMLRLAAAEAGDPKAALALALDLIQGADGLPPDPEAAGHALDLALASPDPGVQAMALTLRRQLQRDGALPAPSAEPPRPRLRPAPPEGAAP